MSYEIRLIDYNRNISKNYVLKKEVLEHILSISLFILKQAKTITMEDTEAIDLIKRILSDMRVLRE